MTSLRDEVRRASNALSQASAQADVVDARYVRRGFSDAQLKQIKQSLLQTAQDHLDIVRAAVLEGVAASALPGLPSGSIDDSSLREALGGVWSALAEFETLGGGKEASIAAYRQAVGFAPSNVSANAQLADLLESRHNLPDARAHAEVALRIDPTNLIAGLTLARVLLRQEKFADAERAALAQAQASRTAVDDRALAWALVGEARDRMNDPAAAFEAFTRGNRLMLQRHVEARDAPHPAHPASVRALTHLVERMPQADPFVSDTPAPVFLIGFPRSGTTLLEQVLSAHSAITCLGETNYLFEAMSVVLKDGDLFARVGTLTGAEIETVRRAYRRMVLADHPDAENKLIVDKHPLHITLLPLIHRIFPDAKIVLTNRDPRDVVLSCYQQCFSINVATAQFLELDRAASYFDAVMSLMTTCRQRLKLDLCEVSYEDVVADLESHARHMAALLGVSFEPAMLRFDEHARTRQINSASARQVINPIYGRSVGRWRRYERELAPVLPVLNKWARRLGYEE